MSVRRKTEKEEEEEAEGARSTLETALTLETAVSCIVIFLLDRLNRQSQSKTDTYHIEARLLVLLPGKNRSFFHLDKGTNSGQKSQNRCRYNCKTNGSCSVRLLYTGSYSGSVLGSCYSIRFGGTCSRTPTGCVKCLKVSLFQGAWNCDLLTLFYFQPCKNKKGYVTLPATR
jgi:hypothetical protein